MNETTFSLNSRASSDYGAIVIGGGFYGARLASMLRRRGLRVPARRAEASLLTRPLRNQARVHNGYHYPRSILIDALAPHHAGSRRIWRLRARGFTHYYAVAGTSKVTAGQFANLQRSRRRWLGAAHVANRLTRRGSKPVRGRGGAFDGGARRADDTRARAGRRRVARRKPRRSPRPAAAWRSFGCERGAGPPVHRSTRPRSTPSWPNRTYSRLNQLLRRRTPNRFQRNTVLTVRASSSRRRPGGAAVTVMDGPFFADAASIARLTLSHVRYTPHYNWHDRPNHPSSKAYDARRVAVRAHGARRDAPSRRSDAVRRLAWRSHRAAQREGRQPPDPGAARRAPGADHGWARRSIAKRHRRRTAREPTSGPARRVPRPTPTDVRRL